MIPQYTVIGQPIAHSLSPQIHQTFAKLTQRKIQYTRTEATKDTFTSTVKKFQANGGQGCNVTVPFKEDAFELCDRLHESASLARAVNTLWMHKDGSLVGHNTDGSGLLQDLEARHHIALAGKRILILGAGGATRGVIGPLLSRAPEQLDIANRTTERSELLAADFSQLGNIKGFGLDALETGGAYDVVLNATSMSLQGAAPPLTKNNFSKGAAAYDLMYSAEDTPFMAQCRSMGVEQVYDGFGMLVEQAADAFLIWEGVRPKTQLAYAELTELKQTSK